MERDDVTFWVTIGSAACWILCFWWMHRISTAQNALLAQLREQGMRIERLSKDEHDLLKEVHPQIGMIADKVEQVATHINGDG